LIKKSKILIIGGCGFIGYHLANKLAKKENKNKITIIDNLSRGVFDSHIKSLIKNEGVKFKKIDLTKNNNIKSIDVDFDYIFQFAAILGVDKVIMNPSDVLYNNVMIHFNSCKIARIQKKLKKFIFSSTSEVFIGSSLKNKLKYPTKENHEILLPNLINPRTSYMMSKIFCETLNNFSNLPYINIRPHNIFGPRMGMAHVIPEIIINSLKIKRKEKFILKNPNHKRSFCYISDAINQIIFITSSKKYINDTFNIGSDKNEISMNGLAKQIHKIINRDDIKIVNLKREHNSSPRRRLPDMSKIKKNYLAYNQIGLINGIIKTYKWYKGHFTL
tara:strand:- start:1744 stop:2736 length:993 start_codon:yes stop_codon:yes gene_type:complete